MKKLNKKGFTIVELVIVIAVIAILAGVLIPTFATVVEKANQSSALQGARNAVSLIEIEEDGQIPDGTYYIKSGDYYFTMTNKELDVDSMTKDAPTVLGARLYNGNTQFNKVEVYKSGAVSFDSLRTESTDDNSYNAQNGKNCTISLSANNVITITVNSALVKTTSSDNDQGEGYWVGIKLPTNYTYNNSTSEIDTNDPWLYIKANEVINSGKTFTLTKDSKTETYTVKVVLGEGMTTSTAFATNTTDNTTSQ